MMTENVTLAAGRLLDTNIIMASWEEQKWQDSSWEEQKWQVAESIPTWCGI